MPDRGVLPAPWWVVSIVSACCIVLAYDSASLTQRGDVWWGACYTVAAAAIIIWRATGNRAWLVTWGAALFAATFSRIGLFVYVLWQSGDRLSGIALNTMLLVFARRFTLSQGRWAP